MAEEKSALDSAYERSVKAYEKGTSLKTILAACAAITALVCAVLIGTVYKTRGTVTDFSVPEPDKHVQMYPCDTISLDSYTFDIKEEMYSRSAVMINVTTGHVVCKKNENAELYPASLTKMMTVLVALENVQNPEQTITVSGNGFARLAEENASVAGLKAGDTVSILDLCYATILPSGADAAITLAEFVSGSEENFVAKMNLRAVELGMNDTHFRNVTGLHNDNHYSTAYDLAVMMQHAMKNEYFHQVITTEKYTLTGCGLSVYSTVFDKANKMTVNKLRSAKLLGGKSGYTPEAGLCLATVTQYGEHEFITVTLCADGTLYTPQYAMIDTYMIVNNYAY